MITTGRRETDVIRLLALHRFLLGTPPGHGLVDATPNRWCCDYRARWLVAGKKESSLFAAPEQVAAANGA
jgi:hypothetical protein